MADGKHDCPKVGCPARLDFEVLACKAYWYQLPPTLRVAIGRVWRSGDLDALLRYRREAVAVLNA